jgi:hypothetical protein
MNIDNRGMDRCRAPDQLSQTREVSYSECNMAVPALSDSPDTPRQALEGIREHDDET